MATTLVTSVADAPLIGGLPLPIAAAQHVPLNSVPVATFVDVNPGASEADFAATIDWGDGSGPDANAQVVRVGGSAAGAIFAVYGSHTFNPPGSYSTVVTVNDLGGQSLTISSFSSNVTVARSTLSVDVLPQTAHAGTPIPAGTVIGTFIDALGTDPLGAYTASIDWGDGSPADTAVTITPIAGTSFSVAANLGHTYLGAGSYALKLTVGESPASGIGGNFVVVSGNGVTPPVLTPSSPIVGVEGTHLSNQVVATFTDSTPGATASSFGAAIDWGDGSPTSFGSISNGNAPGNFAIHGDHTYSRVGSFMVGVSLVDSAGNRAGTSTTATASDAPLSNASGLALTAAEGVPLANVPLGSFVDGNRQATAADFAATIDWGDGSATSTGLVTLAGGSASGPLFSVVGSHTYAASGAFTVTVTVNDSGGMTSTISSQATVRASQISASPGFPVAATEGLPTAAGQVIATFSHGANLAPIGNFTATIDWGDGTPAVAGTIAANGSGYRVVAPSHTFAGPGFFVVHVSIGDLDNPTGGAMTASLAVVAASPAPVVPLTASVILNPSDDHGASNADGITNDNTPSFLGASAPGSTILLYASSASGTAPWARA